MRKGPLSLFGETPLVNDQKYSSKSSPPGKTISLGSSRVEWEYDLPLNLASIL